MQLVKSITPKKIKTLRCLCGVVLGLLFAGLNPVSAQDNSPYSRYGLGDLVPSTNVTNRSLGGIAAGYSDFLSINYSNPASYSTFQSYVEAKSKKMNSGRALFDVGMNFENRTLREPSKSTKFTASNALFSHVMVGVPLKANWGLSFGLRPISRISYDIYKNERLVDPLTGLPIDSANTRYTGDGGTFLASMGTGFTVFKKVMKSAEDREQQLSFGFNFGYLFGTKDYSTRRTLINDTVEYRAANYETKTNFGNIHFDVGFQYRLPIKNLLLLTIGGFGNWQQNLNATQDRIRETFVFDDNQGNVRVDSVSDIRDIKGKVILPANVTIGFTLQKLVVVNKSGGWLFGIDYSRQNWSNYRFYGQADSVQNKWEIRAGAQISPAPKRTYWSYVNYRFGVFAGPDYIKFQNKLSTYGASFGLGLPIIGRNASAGNQTTRVNLGFEYGKRGNNTNLLKENNFRFSIGLSLSDAWFIKRKYD